MKSNRIITLAFTLFAFALPQLQAKGEPVQADAQLRQKVLSLISNVDLSPMQDFEQEATIKFLVNGQNEIVVLTVHTRSEFLDRYIKERLNYSHIGVAGVKKMKPYMLNVRFVKES